MEQEQRERERKRQNDSMNNLLTGEPIQPESSKWMNTNFSSQFLKPEINWEFSFYSFR